MTEAEMLSGEAVDFGLKATDSGDGRLNVELGMECALPTPHIVVPAPPEVAMGAASVLRNFIRKTLAPVSGRTGSAELDEVRVEMSWNPDDPVALVTVWGLEDAVWHLAYFDQ